MKRKKNYIPTNMKPEETLPNEEEQVTEEPVEEEKEEKEMGFFKKHWKKLAVGGGLLLATAGGIFLATKSDNDNEEPDCFEPVTDEDDVPFDTQEESSEEQKDS